MGKDAKRIDWSDENGGRMSEIKPWRCINGHVLGQVQRNGSGIRQLLLYRNAIDEKEMLDEVDVMAIVEGYVANVRCSICGQTRTWVPGEEALRALLERTKKGG